MNNERRKVISSLLEKLEDIQGSVESLQNEEQETYDNMPESLQGSEKGQAVEAAAAALQEAVDALSEVMNSLEVAQE